MKTLPDFLDPARMPRHVAAIMDGNGRWAKKRGLPRSAGHAAGMEALRQIVRATDDWGISCLTVYAFSTENWVRSKEEVGFLMNLLLRYFASELDELHEKNVKIRILGDVNGLPEAQKKACLHAMEKTKENTGLNLCIALNYGGRAELLNAARILVSRAQHGELKAEDLTEDMLRDALYTRGLPDVDLLIRTSGEMRLSNFLPFQSTYAELVFGDTLWPDYTRELYARDIAIFQQRDRRFGGVQSTK